MGGMYVALWIFAAILAGSPPTSWAKTWLFVLAVGWGPAGFLLTQGWRFFVYGELGHDVSANPQHLLLRFSLWEWLLFVCLFPALLLVVACLPGAWSGARRKDLSRAFHENRSGRKGCGSNLGVSADSRSATRRPVAGAVCSPSI